MAKEKAPCPECGGIKFGRGYMHKAGCSLAFKPNSKPGKRAGRKSRVRTARSNSNAPMTALARMPIEAVIELRHAVDATLKARQSEVKQMIGSLKDALG